MVSIGTQYNKFTKAQREFNSLVPIVDGTDTFFAVRVITTETSAFDNNATYGYSTIGTDATLVKGSNTARQSLMIINNTGGDIYVGTGSGIASSGTDRGCIVYNKASFYPEVTDDIYGIMASGTGEVYYWEE